MTDYDYIVSGLGCAGMSLMHYLLDSPLKDKKILLIDSSTKTKNDRTWCYWAKEPLAIHPKSTPLVSWSKIKIRHEDDYLIKDMEDMKYFHITASDFNQELLQKFIPYPNITRLTDKVVSILPKTDNTIEVLTANNGSITAGKVFNSIPLNPNFKKDLLRQVFIGWEISTKETVFDSRVATLMDFAKKENMMEFFYVLPFNGTTALIEYTAYTTGTSVENDIENKISDYIQNNYGPTAYTIQYKESGSIPMSTYSFAQVVHPNIIPMGSLGGCTKPSTGYTFHDIQKHCKQLVKQLTDSGNHFNYGWERQPRFRFYDNIILNIAKKWPASLPIIFSEMFKKNSAKSILSFLSEETTFVEEMQILWKLKFGIFIKSLLHYEKH